MGADRLVRCALVTALGVVLWVCAGAVSTSAGKITVDPNITSPSARPPDPGDNEKDPLDRDGRLDRKITINTCAESCASVVAVLSELTGVSMKAGQNGRDWLSRERKISVFAKDVPAREIMRSMARVMKYKWRETGGGDVPRYRFYADRKALIDAANERAKHQERREKRLARDREALLTQLGELAKLSPEEAAAYKDKDPFVYVLASTGAASAVHNFLTEYRPAADAIKSGSYLTLSAADLPDNARQAMWNVYTALWRLEQLIEPRRGQDIPSAPPEDLSRLVLSINREDSTPEQESDILLGHIDVNMHGSGPVEMPLFSPHSDLAKLFGKAVIMVSEAGVDPLDVEETVEQGMRRILASAYADAHYGDPQAAHPDDPELDRKVKLKDYARTAAEFLRAFSSETGFAVVSDSFASKETAFTGMTSIKREGPMKEILDSFAEDMFYNWWRSGPVIELRARDWFEKQELLIPQAWLEGWRRTLKTTGVLDIDDLAQMARLSRGQLSENMIDDEVLNSAGLPWQIEPSREILNLYAVLSPEQTAALFADNGLELWRLSEAQWPYLLKLVKGTDPSRLRDPGAGFRLTARREPADMGEEPQLYMFTLTSKPDDGIPARTWSVPIIRYEEPATQNADESSPSADTGAN